MTRSWLLAIVAFLAVAACDPSPPPATTTDPPTTLTSLPPVTTTEPSPTTTTEPSSDRVLSGQVHVDGLVVAAGETVTFDPARDTTVETAANVIVEGTLRMRPDPGVTHVLRFSDVDESAMVGGGLDPIATDIGLWCMASCVLDIQGREVTAWNRTGDDPTWLDTDDVRTTEHLGAHQIGTTPTRFHAAVPPYEVVNLTRSVSIEGTPGGKAHVFIRSDQPQTIRHVEFRWLGPTPPDGTNLGRYPLHFHMMGDASRGSLVEGAVVRDSSARAFVAHGSHGVTFVDTVAWSIVDSAYWWDPNRGTDARDHDSNDITYRSAVACDVTPGGDGQGSLKRTWGAFHLTQGTGGAVIDSVACHVYGPVDAAGFAWPPNEEQAWQFAGNVAHSVSTNGAWVWQNSNSFDHTITDFTVYDTRVCIDSGAYRQRYRWDDIVCVGASVAGLELHTFAASDVAAAPWRNWCVVDTPIGVDVLSSGAGVRTHPVTIEAEMVDVQAPVSRSDNQPGEDRLTLVDTDAC